MLNRDMNQSLQIVGLRCPRFRTNIREVSITVVDGIWFTVLVMQPDFEPEAVYKLSRYSSILYKSLMPRTMTWIGSVPRIGK